MGFIIVSFPILALFALPGKFSLAENLTKLYVGAVLIGAGWIVYGEIRKTGPTRELIGTTLGDSRLAYLLTQGILTFGFFFFGTVLGLPIALYIRRRLLLADPITNGLQALFESILSSASGDETFLSVHTRRHLVMHMEDLALIMKMGLWKTVRPPNKLARSVLKHRCDLAGQAVEMMCVWVTLPAKTTRADFLNRMCTLAETLLSGRLDELPVEPRRSAISLPGKLFVPLMGFIRTMLIGAAPLGFLHILRLLGAAPPASIAGYVLTIFWIWLLAALASALDELRTGRTLFGDALELYSRLTGK